MSKYIIFDRDGVLNKDYGYVYRWSVLLHNRDFTRQLGRWRKRGFRFIIVTNQSGIGRGLYSERHFKTFQTHFSNYYKRFGIRFEAVYYCPHDPLTGCICRKPSPFLVKKAIMRYKINKSSSIGVGDKITDIQAFKNAGIKNNILFKDNNSLRSLGYMKYKNII